MKKTTCFMIAASRALSSFAQDGTVKDLKKDSERSISKDPKDTVQRQWKTGGNFALNLNQGTLSNWSAGGDKFSLSVNSLLSLFAYYKQGKNSWDNSLDLAYGIDPRPPRPVRGHTRGADCRGHAGAGADGPCLAPSRAMRRRAPRAAADRRIGPAGLKALDRTHDDMGASNEVAAVYAQVGLVAFGVLGLLHGVVWRALRVRWRLMLAVAFTLGALNYGFDFAITTHGYTPHPLGSLTVTVGFALMTLAVVDYLELPARVALAVAVAVVSALVVVAVLRSLGWVPRGR